MRSGHVGTEHLLLGLTRQDEGVGAQVLAKMGVSLAKVRSEIEGESPDSSESDDDEPKLTPKAKRVLELAADEARRMRHNYIGTEHLLLALLREKDELAATVLHRLGLNLKDARAQVLEYLGSDVSTPVEPPVDHFDIAPAVWQLLDEAAQESREQGAAQTEVVHLLFAMCRADSESAQHLQAYGVDTARLLERLQNGWQEN